MEPTPEEYTRFYIVQALFRLMKEISFEKIGVTDIAQKAGVGRATFYRYFKRKEDVLVYYFEHNTKDFMHIQRFYPRCKEDYIAIAQSAFGMFRENEEVFRLIKRARLEYLYLDFLNKSFVETFENDRVGGNRYSPYLYAGMLFNVSMAWLENGCEGSAEELARSMVEAIYFGN